MATDTASAAQILLPCPFCGCAPTTIERPDNIDGTQFFYAIACYCGHHSACAHKMAVRKTPEIAKADAIAAWNTRAPQPTQAQAGAVPLDEARRLFDAGWKAAARFCDREDVVADGIIGFGACPQFEAAFAAANGIKGGQHA